MSRCSDCSISNRALRVSALEHPPEVNRALYGNYGRGILLNQIHVGRIVWNKVRMVMFAGMIEQRCPIIHQSSGRAQHLADWTDVDVRFLIIGDVAARERPIGVCGKSDFDPKRNIFPGDPSQRRRRDYLVVSIDPWIGATGT
jgi:hypothetical protein